MIIIEKDITLREAIQKYELPFMLRRASYTPNFVFRAERVTDGIVKGTPYKDGIEYTGRSYEYSLSQTVSIFEGAVRKETPTAGTAPETTSSKPEPTSPSTASPVSSTSDEANSTSASPTPVKLTNLLGFSDNLVFRDFFNEQVMNASFADVMQRNTRSTISIRILVINYLCLIKRKFRVLFKDKTPLEKTDSFRLIFPAYTNAGVSCFQDLNNLINRILDCSFSIVPKDYHRDQFAVGSEVDDLLKEYRCEISTSSNRFFPELMTDNRELTVFGVFAIINSLLHNEERNAFVFDLLGEVSNRSKYYLQKKTYQLQ